MRIRSERGRARAARAGRRNEPADETGAAPRAAGAHRDDPVRARRRGEARAARGAVADGGEARSRRLRTRSKGWCARCSSRCCATGSTPICRRSSSRWSRRKSRGSPGGTRAAFAGVMFRGRLYRSATICSISAHEESPARERRCSLPPPRLLRRVSLTIEDVTMLSPRRRAGRVARRALAGVAAARDRSGGQSRAGYDLWRLDLSKKGAMPEKLVAERGRQRNQPAIRRRRQDVYFQSDKGGEDACLGGRARRRRAARRSPASRAGSAGSRSRRPATSC